jgi:NAD(P)H-hydrate epimerase
LGNATYTSRLTVVPLNVRLDAARTLLAHGNAADRAIYGSDAIAEQRLRSCQSAIAMPSLKRNTGDAIGLLNCPSDAVSWITVAQMREVDRVAIDLGLTLTRMMENAGTNLAWLALAMLGGDAAGRRVAVLAGRGGNGGGGLVAARRLIGWGADVDVHLASDPGELAPVPLEQLKLLERMGASVSVGASGISSPELFIDAILGYSQAGDPRGRAAELIRATDGFRALSLDVPSGLEIEHGTAGKPALTAEATLTLALPKAALRLEVAAPLVGALYLADISIPPIVYERLGIPYRSPFSRGPIVRLV